MKNYIIIASWNRILPDEDANERMRSKIMEYQRSNARKDRVISMTSIVKRLIPIAACFVLVLAVTVLIGIRNDHTGEITDEYGEGSSGSYSVACFPEGRVIEDVAKATCLPVTEEDSKKINGLCDYVPSEIPTSYCWGTSGLYETTMKDGTIYRMLKITYRSGDDTVTIDNENGAATIDSTAETRDFCVSVCDFKPDIADIINYESINEELISEKIKNGIFCIEYDGYYVTIEPLLLTTDEVKAMINSIK